MGPRFSQSYGFVQASKGPCCKTAATSRNESCSESVFPQYNEKAETDDFLIVFAQHNTAPPEFRFAVSTTLSKTDTRIIILFFSEVKVNSCYQFDSLIVFINSLDDATVFSSVV